MSAKERVGFIGLGSMGVGMAANVAAAGYPLTIMGHTRREPVERLLGMGAKEVTSPAQMRAECDVIILCVTTSDAVEGIVTGDDGLMSSALLAENGCSMMDVPLGKSAQAAEDGTLNMMAGGSVEDFNRAKPLLDTMSENLFHVGELGIGHRIKLINNGFSMAVACLAAEAMATAKAGGVDLAWVRDVMVAGPNRSDFFEWMMASAVDGDETKLAFALKNGFKDMGYFNAMAEEVNVNASIPMAAYERMKSVVEAGHGEENVPALMRHIKQ